MGVGALSDVALATSPIPICRLGSKATACVGDLREQLSVVTRPQLATFPPLRKKKKEAVHWVQALPTTPGPELDPWNPCNGRREPAPQSCFLTSTQAVEHSNSLTPMYNIDTCKIFKNKLFLESQACSPVGTLPACLSMFGLDLQLCLNRVKFSQPALQKWREEEDQEFRVILVLGCITPCGELETSLEILEKQKIKTG